jgi:hypothetical protein
VEKKGKLICKLLLTLGITTATLGANAQSQDDVIRVTELKENEVEAIKKEFLTTNLKDPYSVQLKDLSGVKSSKESKLMTVCGSFNAKNSYGGYTGFRTFYAVLSGENVFILIISESLAEERCAKVFRRK